MPNFDFDLDDEYYDYLEDMEYLSNPLWSEDIEEDGDLLDEMDEYYND